MAVWYLRSMLRQTTRDSGLLFSLQRLEYRLSSTCSISSERSGIVWTVTLLGVSCGWIRETCSRTALPKAAWTERQFSVSGGQAHGRWLATLQNYGPLLRLPMVDSLRYQ